MPRGSEANRVMSRPTEDLLGNSDCLGDAGPALSSTTSILTQEERGDREAAVVEEALYLFDGLARIAPLLRSRVATQTKKGGSSCYTTGLLWFRRVMPGRSGRARCLTNELNLRKTRPLVCKQSVGLTFGAESERFEQMTNLKVGPLGIEPRTDGLKVRKRLVVGGC